MARQKLTKPNSTTALAKLVVRVWEDDLKFIQKHYPDNYNAQVRRIISNWVADQQEGIWTVGLSELAKKEVNHDQNSD